ncbi:MAG: DHH family phosphoesterase [Bacilli bacterium]|nr:DHH family phosphoesterase [Bacilli bacterium]
MNEFLNKVLKYYNLSLEEYEKLSAPVTLNDLPYAYAFFNFEKFMMRIEEAIKNDEEVVIYGDYDADGIMATSILKKAFLKRGKNVYTMIPSRYKDGYGLNERAVNRLHKRGITLIITVDNGVSAHKAIKHANSLGIDVLVSDHHELSATLPDAYAVLHPDLSSLPAINSCGAYMALVISYGLLTYYDEYLVSLAAIATLADMMPLVDRNRTVVKLGISFLNINKPFSVSTLNGSQLFDEVSLGMRVAPRINALGRLSQNYEANILVEYFTTDDVKRMYDISVYVEKVYEERKNLSKASELSEEELNNPAIVLLTTELEGILGLIAQSYLLTHNKPALIFTESSEDDTLIKGSARSSSGFNVVEAFATLKDYILASGGHPEAGGLTIKKADFLNFKRDFLAYAALHPLVSKKEKYIEAHFEDLNPENYKIINNLAPFGFKFPSPTIKIVDGNTYKYTYSRDGKHIISTLENGIKLIGFSLGEEVRNKKEFAIYGTFSQSEFRNVVSIEFKIKQII